MTIAFEYNRSDWEIRATFSELIRVHMMLMSINRNPSNKNVAWLIKVSPTKRAWVITNNSVTTWITVDGDPTDPYFALPIPDHFISSLIDLSHDESGVDIFCNEHDGTIVGRANGRYAVVDHPEEVEFTENNMPYRSQPHGSHNSATLATVEGADLLLFADLVLNWHYKQEMSDKIWPFASIEIANNQFAWTVDWRRHGMFRTSGGVPAVTNGTITTQFFPYMVARLLKSHDNEGDIKVFIGSDDADFVYFAGEDWGIRVVNDLEMNIRWHYKLHAALWRLELQPEFKTTERVPDFIPFDLEGLQCYASVHPLVEGLSEFGRLTYVVARNVEPTLKLYEELNELNATLSGSSVILRDNEVRVVTDFALSEDMDLTATVASFAKAIEKIGQVYELLPLFATPDCEIGE